MFANVFLAGCQKAGSTSLAEYLSRHPDCLLSHRKENAFFSKLEKLSDLSRYGRHFIPLPGQTPKVRVDATTAYMPDVRVPGLLRGALGPDLKFIFILRAPAARAYSGYMHLYKRGQDRRDPEAVFGALRPDLAWAEQEELGRLARAINAGEVSPHLYRSRYDNELWAFQYLANTAYRRHVERFEGVFGAERVLVLTFEQSLAAPAELAATLGRFLDLDPSGFPEGLPHRNPTRLPVKPTLRNRLARIVKGRPNVVDVRPQPALASPEIAASLRDLFASETDYWSDRLGQDLRAQGW
ncbi:sulfotransferase [Caulobacter sp. SLTY]|uniref:sulfotransferase domain-containing protein n=1 Tax=Caulobacter sp. SLTY TaxID=2683262 RepID=UPI001412A7FD|nr:sulfotransferase [Caulobacter sp. SLTY]